MKNTRLILGIIDGIHDSGAALIRDGKILAAVNEERLTGQKLKGGFPKKSIKWVLQASNISWKSIDSIAIAGALTPALPTRIFRVLQEMGEKSRGVALKNGSILDEIAYLLRFRWKVWDLRPNNLSGKILSKIAIISLKNELGQVLSKKPMLLVEHHRAHATGAWLNSNFKECLVISADSVGDGIGLAVYKAHSNKLTRISWDPFFNSIATFWALMTKALGFLPDQDEGKVMSLSAFGDSASVNIPFPYFHEKGHIICEYSNMDRLMKLIEKLVKRKAGPDICSWLQRGTEKAMLDLILYWLKRAKTRKLSLAGGLFANALLNMKISQLEEIDDFWVFPHPGDGGLGLGAALSAQFYYSSDDIPRFHRLEDVFLGPLPDEKKLKEPGDKANWKRKKKDEKSLRGEKKAIEPGDKANWKKEKIKQIKGLEPIEFAAEKLAEGEEVACIRGRMEWGPRALGNRSILAPGDDENLKLRLNLALGRQDFMPFACAILEEDWPYFFDDHKGLENCLFMSMTLPLKNGIAREYPGIVHRDNTARPQLIRAVNSPFLFQILRKYREKTGKKALINTSFNSHGEIMVRDEKGAIDSFHKIYLNNLIIGDKCFIRSLKYGNKKQF